MIQRNLIRNLPTHVPGATACPYGYPAKSPSWEVTVFLLLLCALGIALIADTHTRYHNPRPVALEVRNGR